MEILQSTITEALIKIDGFCNSALFPSYQRCK